MAGTVTEDVDDARAATGPAAVVGVVAGVVVGDADGSVTGVVEGVVVETTVDAVVVVTGTAQFAVDELGSGPLAIGVTWPTKPSPAP